MSEALSVYSCLEAEYASSQKNQDIWGMVSLTANSLTSAPFDVDLLVILDISEKMSLTHIEHIKQTLKRILNRLDHRHTFSLIVGQTNCTETPVKCTLENKRLLSSKLDSIHHPSSPNLIVALKDMAELASRPRETARELAVFLFSNGDLPVFPGKNIDLLTAIKCPKLYAFHVFGMGEDANSELLCSVANYFRGTYHHTNHLHLITDECLTRILNIRLSSVKVNLKCRDGCRLVTIRTPFPIHVRQPVKEYTIQIGSISDYESKTIVFRLSLRKVDIEHGTHPLLSIEINSLLPTGLLEKIFVRLSIIRMKGTPPPSLTPKKLQYHLNRIATVGALGKFLEDGIEIQMPGDFKEMFSVCKSNKHMTYSMFSSQMFESLFNLALLQPVCYTEMPDVY